jgi:hypothetical protein
MFARRLRDASQFLPRLFTCLLNNRLRAPIILRQPESNVIRVIQVSQEKFFKLSVDDGFLSGGRGAHLPAAAEPSRFHPFTLSRPETLA